MTTDNVTEPSAITARQLPPGGLERINCLPRHFGRAMLLFENSVYAFANRLCKDYRGGFWHFYELSNGGFYMSPELGVETVRIEVDGNGFEGQMSCDAAGVTVCLFVFSHLSFVSREPCWSEHFHRLREYATTHREAAAIFAAID